MQFHRTAEPSTCTLNILNQSDWRNIHKTQYQDYHFTMHSILCEGQIDIIPL